MNVVVEMDIPAAAISAPGLQLNFYQIEALFLQLTLIGMDSEMKKNPIFILAMTHKFTEAKWKDEFFSFLVF